jgi:glucose dehydrogenase
METEMLQMLENERKNEKQRVPERTRIKITKKTTNICPLKLDFDAPAYTGALFSLSDLCCRRSSNGIPKALDMETLRVLWTKKMAEEMFTKHVQTYLQKTTKCIPNEYPNRNPK